MSETKEWIKMAEKAVLDGDYLKSISLSLLVLMWDVSESRGSQMRFKRGSSPSQDDWLDKEVANYLEGTGITPCNDWMVKCDKCKGRADVLHADLSGDNLCKWCKNED